MSLVVVNRDGSTMQTPAHLIWMVSLVSGSTTYVHLMSRSNSTFTLTRRLRSTVHAHESAYSLNRSVSRISVASIALLNSKIDIISLLDAET